MKDIIYIWYRGESPIKGKIIGQFTEKSGSEEIENIEVETKHKNFDIWREKDTDQWYDEHSNEIYLSKTKPKYKKAEINFSIYD